MEKNYIITIGRQFCSGGILVGKAVAERLGYEYYDKKRVAQIAKEKGYPEEIFKKMENVATSSFLYSLAMGFYAGQNLTLDDNNIMTNRELFDIQSEIIEDLAKKGKGVFVGRCADYVLREEENLVKIFIRADMDYRVDLYEKHHRKPENRSVEYVLEGMDRKKNTYYQFYTAMDWMDIKNYDLVINTAKVGIDAAVDMIVEYIKNMR